MFKYNRTNIFTDDMLIHYMLYLDIETTRSLLCIDKNAALLYLNKYLWRMKIEHCLDHCLDKTNLGNYIGEYTLEAYLQVANALYQSKNLAEKYANGTTEFDFDGKDWNILGNEFKVNNYDQNLYRRQIVTICYLEKNVTILCYFKENRPYAHKWCFTTEDISMLLFNLFYYYPNITPKI